MPESTDNTKPVVVHLTEDQIVLLDQEKNRLRNEYGLHVNTGGIIRVLIELHRLRLQGAASNEADARLWMYEYLRHEENDDA